MKRTITLLSVALIGLIICYREISGIDNTFFLDSTFNFALEAAGIAYLIWIFFRDRKEYRKAKQWTAFLPTIAGVCIGIGLLITLHILSLRDKSPVAFSCVSKIVDFNGVYIDFRQDGTYKLDNFCLGSNFFRGKYTIRDSIITLDKSSIDKVIVSNRLLIRADGQRDSSGNIEKSIYQVDKEGKIIDGAVDYRLIKERAD